MKADAILNKIREDAKDLSADILSEAKTKAENLQYQARIHMQEMRKQTEENAKLEADEMRKQMESLNELELKKELLAEKRKLIDDAFASAQDMLRNLSTEEVRTSVSDLLINLAEGGETLSLGEYKKEWLDENVLKDINSKLVSNGKAPITLSSSVVKGYTGAILSKNGVDTNCTLEAVLDSMKGSLENEVANILFNKQEG